MGEVVSIREQLNWFEKRPLLGKGVVITRPEAQAEDFANLLHERGARVIHFPTIQIVPPASWTACDTALDQLAAYRWIIFTSANGVRFFFRRLHEKGLDVRDLKGIRLCTIGPATAAALEAKGLTVDLVPATYISEGVVAAFAGQDMQGKRVLLPRAEEARDVIPEGLARQGAQVDVVPVYRTIGSDRRKKDLEAFLNRDEVDVIAFTSPSTVNHFMEIMGRDFVMPAKVKIAVIGPVTAAAVGKAGLPAHIIQEIYTIPGLVDGIADYFYGDPEAR